jgi:hypothetical protein
MFGNIGNNDYRTLASKLQRPSLANAASATGYDRNFVSQFHNSLPLLE